MSWSVDAWQNHLLAQVLPLDPSTVRVQDAHGCTVAVDVRSRHDLPLWDNSAMDGFAVRSGDTAAATPAAPVTLRVTGEVAAGSGDDPALAAGDAVRIMTGAPLPSGADAVVRFEAVTSELLDGGSPWSTDTISAQNPVRSGADIRFRGEDMSRGEIVARAGERLGANLVAAIAAAGCADVLVRPAPRVGVIVTGSELVPAGNSETVLARGMIPESNSVLLSGLVREAGATVVASVHVSDDADELRGRIAELSRECDAIVLTGGVGPGAHDVVRQVLEAEPRVTVAEVRVRPGKPQCAGRVDAGVVGDNAGEAGPTGSMVFGLSGNPVAAAISFELFVRPCLLAMQGRNDVHRRRMRARVVSSWTASATVLQVTPVTVGSDPLGALVCERVIRSSGVSHSVGSAGRANAWALIPEGIDHVVEGDLVQILLLDE